MVGMGCSDKSGLLDQQQLEKLPRWHRGWQEMDLETVWNWFIKETRIS
jgi:hypothetical protein